MKNPQGQFFRSAWIMLAVSLLITVFSSLFVKATLTAKNEEQFRDSSREIQGAVDARIENCAQLLRSVSALFAASESLTRSEWRQFYDRAHINIYYPGLQALGYSYLVHKEDLPDYQRQIRDEGFPDFRVFPAGDRQLYNPVTYLEPFSGRNLKAFGFDAYSDPVRRAFMDRAMDEDLPILSRKITLIQETDTDIQAGAIMYLPLYRRGVPTETVTQRREAIVGFVYGAIRAGDLMQTLPDQFENFGGNPIRFQVYDGAAVSEENLLFDSAPPREGDHQPLLSKEFQLQTSGTFAHRPWTLVFSRPYLQFPPFGPLEAWMVFGAGLAISLLLFGWLRSIVATGTLARNIADELTAELRQSEEKYRLIFEYSPLGILSFDEKGVIVACNSTFAQIVGAAQEQLTGLNMLDLPDKKLAATVQTALSGNPGIYEDHYESMTSGKVTPVRALFAPIDVGGGQILGGVGIIEDITEQEIAAEEQRHLQSQLMQSQKMESLGSLAGGVAHDMNNVLGAILGLSSAHLEDVSPDSEIHETLETIAKAAVRGGKMVKSLLSFSRQSPAEEMEVDLNEVLREEVLLLERTILSQIHLDLNLDPDLLPIVGDSSALSHAFMNLCVNAMDAMPENGTLTLRTRMADKRWVEVEVEDTGSGMPNEVLEKALDPFFTTKDVGKGTGLGLAMVFSTVSAHHGNLEIFSKPGRGTCVRMRFPAVDRESHTSQLVPDKPLDSQDKQLIVLTVDDDDLVQRAMKRILTALGHQVTAAFSGEDALATIESGFRPDVIILDMNMPGLGGEGTLPRLRALCPAVPIFLATGRADQAALDLVAEFDNVTLLAKPFSMKDLDQLLRAIWQE